MRPPGWEVIGTPDECASIMQEAMEEIGGDGFLITGPLVPRYVNSVVDELVPVPTRQTACRLTVSYAGFTGESVLLEDLYRRLSAAGERHDFEADFNAGALVIEFETPPAKFVVRRGRTWSM